MCIVSADLSDKAQCVSEGVRRKPIIVVPCQSELGRLRWSVVSRWLKNQNLAHQVSNRVHGAPLPYVGARPVGLGIDAAAALNELRPRCVDAGQRCPYLPV